MLLEVSPCRITLVACVAFLTTARASTALGDTPPGSQVVSPAATAQAVATQGVAVVALAGATDAAWSLARSVYSTASLRPATVDEAHAHVLCGEGPGKSVPADIRDLAETVAAIRGDGAPSRTLLGDIARRFSVRAVVVVSVGPQGPSARAFLADSALFDGAMYTPDEGSPASWSAATRALIRSFGTGAAPGSEQAAALSTPLRAPALATHPDLKVEAPPARRRAFYESGWFWGALGAAAFGAGAVFLSTRDTGASTIHLQLEVPH